MIFNRRKCFFYQIICYILLLVIFLSIYFLFFKFELRKFQHEKIKWFHILTHSSENSQIDAYFIYIFSGHIYIAGEIIDLKLQTF